MNEQEIAPGIKIIGFESMEEMLTYQAEQERDAIEDTLDEQWAIPWGAYVFRVIDGLVIFGRLFTREEYMEDSGATGELADAWFDRGWRYGQFYSAVVPDGEYGPTHVINLWTITKEEFDRGHANGWTLWRELLIRIKTETEAALERKENHGEATDG